MSPAAPLSIADANLSDGAVAFLRRHGLAEVSLQAFDADASTRRYFRLLGQNLLLMDDRHDPEGFAAFAQISAHLGGLGLSAPRVLEQDRAQGLALIEDMGDDTYARCLARGVEEGALYHLAVEALLHLHHDARGAQIDRPAYDLSVHLDELSIFSQWFAPAVAPDIDVARFDGAFRSLWARALAPVADRHETLVLRDFHVDNLMLLEGREGVARCGLLDFQDAILGPSEYDLLSLLQDARRDLAAGLEEELLTYYCAHAPAHLGGAEAIRQRYALLGAQRHARILGVFVRLCLRDGKARYLAFLTRVLTQFQTALQAAGLAEIADFLNAELPGWAQIAQTLPQTLLQRNGPTND
ncbi:aminoglycoside phosphotransferase family protein [Phaeobacter sp. HF9A]|uniref:aminoglycoside phosphotransferase family protein n=1 Tax=Phaeobacter sp. HF9A TaxID=2721561 RepID=UPI0014308A86|nr:phosphotransferase [Phaeobacter sp. HF9A]NIZ11909.1 phosphotransferase [Phaeobacter sp. HF9A]